MYVCSHCCLQYEVIRYSDPDADLASNDLLALQQQAPPQAAAVEEPADGSRMALRVSFTLPSSAYATMLVRELTKRPTAFNNNLGGVPDTAVGG
jgi:tRNA pseudouridine13 synthase